MTSIVAGLGQIFSSFGRALASQLRPKMILLTFLPCGLSLLIAALLLWLGLQPVNNWIASTFTQGNNWEFANDALTWLGTGAFKAAVMSMLALWLLLPVMLLTALIFVGTLAMPAINRHVSRKQYPDLVRRHGGSFWGTVWVSTISFLAFLFFWIVTLPLALVPPLTFIIHPVLWGWLTYRVMAYDALAEHATKAERHRLMHEHRWPLLGIGAMVGLLGMVPTLLWLGGALSIIILPVLASAAIWLYVVVFVFSGLWFQYYCLEALAQQRADEAQTTASLPHSLTITSSPTHCMDNS